MSGTTGPDVGSWAGWIDGQCRAIESAGQWRAPRDFDAAGPTGVLTVDPTTGEQRDVVSFASNDYLGLTQHPAVKAAAHAAIDRWGTGAGAARLVVGARPVHRALEAELAAWRGTEAAVLFPTGFAANLGVLTTFGATGTRVHSDALNHASIIDGARLARAEVAVYRHHDLDGLARQLHDATQSGRRPIVVTDTVFSMDGDLAPVAGLAALCRRYDALLILDEAHAVLGPDIGAPAASTTAVSTAPADGSTPADSTPARPPAAVSTALVDDADVFAGVTVLRMGTLSKTLGSLGGFVAGPRPAIDLLVNRARSYIFTTASTPADTAAALAALCVVRSPEGAALKARLRTHIDRLVPGHPSPIIPVVVGDERAALAAAAALLDRGSLVPAIRPPTVPRGTSRLRIALSAAHTTDQVDALAKALADIGLADRLGAAVPAP